MGMMNNDAGGNTRWKTWQSDADIPSRKILIQHMYVRQSRRYRTRTNPNAARWHRVARFHIAISRVARSAGVPANGSCRANTDPKSPRIGAACGCFSKGNLPRRRSGNRSSPTSCCAWKRRCTAAPAPRCATFVSLSRRFFHDENRRLGFNSVVSPGVFHRARVFARLFGNAKKSRVCDCRAEPPPEARATPRSRDARRRTRPPLASSDACVGGSARRTRDRAANATRTNRLFVYAPPKPSARRRFFREYATIVSTPRVSSPAPRARYDAIRQHARSRALNTALCPS